MTLTGAWQATTHMRFGRPAALGLLGPHLLVADTAHQLVWRIDRQRDTASICAELDEVSADADLHLAVASDGALWFVDGTGEVHHKRCADRVVRVWSDSAHLTEPAKLSFAPDQQHLYVLDKHDQRVKVYTAGGVYERDLTASHAFEDVVDMLQGSGGLWVLDRGAQQAVRIGQSGQLLEVIGSPELARPSAMAIDKYGRVLIADEAGPRVLVFRGNELVDLWRMPQGRGAYTGMVLDDNVLYAVDSTRGVVDVFLVAPPSLERTAR